MHVGYAVNKSKPTEAVMEENRNEKNTEKDTPESIRSTGSVISSSGEETIHCLTVIGQIEGHYALGDGQKATKYEHLIPLLVSIEESREIDGMLMVLNTMGGDVEAGLALAEMVASMSKPTVSLVLGGGHSIGVPLAVSAKKSFIVPSATMTIHPVRISGTVIGAPQSFYYFEQMQDRIIRFVTEHSAVSEETFRSLLMRTDQIATDVGSIVEGTEAKEIGLIDETGGVSDALAALRTMIREHKKCT
ncbi:MAG: ATP-dependent Clp protease proteolytic subunit [Clostridia bacterium]|nr:ATP-dependent Clp protease proteolytic subunit [Clostridia bacterium]